MLREAIEQYGIYSCERLRDYILGLENRFSIKNEVDFFSQLVNFSKNKDIPYHGWFKYREGFSHTLIKELINRCGLLNTEYVLDPFCGSGTTVVEAALNGYSGMGIDVNPVSAFISKVKCRSYTDEEIKEIKEIVPALIASIGQTDMLEAYRVKYQEVEKFFNKKNFARLIAIRQVLDSNIETYGTKIYELLFCAYICIVEAVSDRKRDGNGLKTQLSRVESVEQYFAEKLEEMITDIEAHRISSELVSIIECGDAMRLSEIVEKCEKTLDKPLGAIMYSPPYANSFDYFESYKMEVILADYASDMKGIFAYRRQAVESCICPTDERDGIIEFI